MNKNEPSSPKQPAPRNNDPFRRLVEIMERLLAEDGCPWDREQSHQTLKPHIIEEAYEVCEAIDQGDHEELCEELGDVGLQIVFHSALAKRAGKFEVDDVYRAICEKLVRRHPHVFSDAVAETSGEVLKNWEAIKKQEREAKGKDKPVSSLDGVPVALPALQRAARLQKKAAKVGFDWDTIEPVLAKVSEECQELAEARHELPQEKIEEEFGDLLFALVNCARFLNIDAEQAVQKTNRKFTNRFQYMEEKARTENKRLSDMTLEEMDVWWDEAKAKGIGA